MELEQVREMELADEAITKKLETIAQKMFELYRIYPRPIQYGKIRTPISEAVLRIEFDEPASMPVYLLPIATPLFVVDADNMIGSVEIGIHNGAVKQVTVIDDTGGILTVDYFAVPALSSLFTPGMLRALRGAKVASESPDAVEWFRELVNTVEFLYGSGEVESIDLHDLLDSRSRFSDIKVYLVKPSRDVDEASVWLHIDDEPMLDVTMINKRKKAKAALVCDLDGSKVKNVVFYAFSEKGTMFFRRPELYLKRFLFSIPDSMFDGVVKFAKKFLKAYKVLRIAASFMEL